MKHMLFPTLILLITLSCNDSLVSTDPDDIRQKSENPAQCAGYWVVKDIPLHLLNSGEWEYFQYLRESDKVLHDLTLVLPEFVPQLALPQWRALSEESACAFQAMYDRYEMADPLDGYGPGKFSHEAMQTRYNQGLASLTSHVPSVLIQLTKESETNYLLFLGASEKLYSDDMLLLFEYMETVAAAQIRLLVSTLDAYGYSYEPSHVDAATWQKILAGR